MKNSEIKEEQQIDMVEDRYGIMRKLIPVKDKINYICKYHKFATENSLIEVTIKKTGEVVKRCLHCEHDKRENKKIQTTEWNKEKENLTDYYIRRTLVVGTKNALPMKDYPDILVEAKRAVIKLKRKNDKLKEPIKKCSKHGNLYADDVIKAGKSRWTGEQKFKCKKCMKELHKKHYELNKIKVLSKHAKYRADNRAKIIIKHREDRQKNRIKYMSDNQRADAYFRHKFEGQMLNKKYKDAKEVENLTDGYIRRKIKYQTGLKKEDIPDVLIEAKRAVLLLRRGIKKKRDEEVFNYLEEKLKNVEN